MGSDLMDSWSRIVRRSGCARAVVEAATGRSATFVQVDEGAGRWAAIHAPSGGLAGRAVLFALPNGVEWLEVFLGVIAAGGVAVPLDPGEPAQAQREIAAAVRAGFIWTGSTLEALPAAGRWRDGRICLLKLTSGSTGAPRPLAFTGAQMIADARQIMATMGFGPRDMNHALIPFGHSYGLGNLTFPLIARGVPVICGTSGFPHAVAEDFARWRPTVFPGVPALWQALAAADVKLPGLRLAISAGAPLAPEVARAFEVRQGLRIHSFYGSSETGGIAYDRSGRATLEGGVGHAMRGVKVRTLRGERIEVCSPAVFTQGNRRRKAGAGCWVPPDRVAIDARGRMTLLGRRGAVVKIAGRRVSLADVAARLRKLDGVRDAWVDASPGPSPQLGAAVVSSRSAADLRAELQRGTAPWRIPKRLVVMPSFPLTPRGKIDTRALRKAVLG